jgi:Hsp70 protein
VAPVAAPGIHCGSAAARLLQEDIRAAKEALSAHPQTEVALPQPFGDALVTRPELEAVIRPKLAQSIQLLATTMNAAALSPANLAGVYLVGGSSRIPLVAQLISEQLRVVPTSLDAPETAVALGAHLLARAGSTLRTDAVTPPVQVQPSRPLPTQAPAFVPPQPPSPKKKKRLVLPALLAVVIIGVAATVYVVTKNSGSGANLKYDATKIPTCASLPLPIPRPGFRIRATSTRRTPATYRVPSRRWPTSAAMVRPKAPWSPSPSTRTVSTPPARASTAS